MHISFNYRIPIGKQNLNSEKAIMILIYPFPIGSHRIAIMILHISISYRIPSENRNLESGKAIMVCIYPVPIGSHRKIEIWNLESYYGIHISFSYRIPSNRYYYMHIHFLSDPIGK